MPSSCWSKVPGRLPLAAVALLFLTSPSPASINQAGALLVPATSAPKYCSGAFRYAALPPTLDDRVGSRRHFCEPGADP